MKNWPPFVFGPELAIDRMPSFECRSFGLNSSSKRVARAAGALAERVAALDHEAVDHAVEDEAVVVRLLHLLARLRVGPLLRALGEADEVGDGLRRVLVEELDGELALRGGEVGVGAWLQLGLHAQCASHDDGQREQAANDMNASSVVSSSCGPGPSAGWQAVPDRLSYRRTPPDAP